jgi:glyoxylase-like metal-dependent hydrolase (beta-lactamase superfamily II)
MGDPVPVHRLGDDVVNFYLVEHPDGLVLVDAGLPGHLGRLEAHLAGSGHALRDIRAVVLTHAHPDHTGLAGALRRAGADIWVHERDAPILRDGPRSVMRHAKPERSMAGYLLRRPGAIGTPLHLARLGGFTAAPVTELRTFAGDTVLAEVPGSPRAVPLPGHTGGSTAYLFPGLDAVFTGDALVTHDGLTGHIGPTLVCRAFTADGGAALASLDRLAELPAALVLPGHGEPFTGGPRAAADQARRAGLH